MDLEHFDIAHYTGHKALDELFYAYKIYTNPIEHVLRACNIQTIRLNASGVSSVNNLLVITVYNESNITIIVNIINSFILEVF